MEYVNINQALKEIENQCILVYVSSAYDSIWISFDTIDKNTIEKYFLTSYLSEPSVWSKNDIIELCLAFNISTIVFPNGSQAQTKDFKKRDLKYAEKLKEYPSLYGKKLIYLIKRTKLTIYMKVFSKKKYLVLAKPDNENIDISIYVDEEKKYIPAFSDSNMLRFYTGKRKISNDYKPYLIPFKELYRKLKSTDLQYVWFNPECCDIHGKSFNLKINKKLFQFVQETINSRAGKN